MYSSDWFISLFTSTIPISQTTKLFNIVFKDSWIGVYKIILTILKSFESNLLNIKEACDILVTLKNNDMFLQNLSSANVPKSEMYWEQIFNDIENEFADIDEDYLNKLRIKYKIR